MTDETVDVTCDERDWLIYRARVRLNGAPETAGLTKFQRVARQFGTNEHLAFLAFYRVRNALRATTPAGYQLRALAKKWGAK